MAKKTGMDPLIDLIWANEARWDLEDEEDLWGGGGAGVDFPSLPPVFGWTNMIWCC